MDQIYTTQQKILRQSIILLIIFAAEIILLFFTPRSNFNITFSLFIILFIGYYVIIRNLPLFSFKTCIGIAILLRLIALLSLPQLSDDYFRFLWDGQMNIMHINPFAYTPDQYIIGQNNSYMHLLHDKMNSAEYYSVYPSVLQYIFAMSAGLFKLNIYGDVMVLKTSILLSEIGTIIILYKYAQLKNINARHILWYALNPLVIIELTGNVHFESIMIFFIVFTFYLIESGKSNLAAICFAFAVCTKLIPLMLLPLFFMYLGIKKFTFFTLIFISVSILLFIPFIDHALLNIGESVGKFYDLFEFNAGIYYLINNILSLFTDADLTEIVAKGLGILSFGLILFASFYKYKNEEFLKRALFIFTIYFLLTTMVHPWYITTLVAFMCLTKFRYPIVFTILIPLSYFPYSLKIFEENMWAILIEYAILFLYMFLEYFSNSRLNKIWSFASI